LIERTFIHVGGTPGSGKTTLVEALLRLTGGETLAARCIRDDSLREAQEARPQSHPELKRYRRAGASAAALFSFPGKDIRSDAFFTTRLMSEFSRVVVLEGDNPLGFVELDVFVASAPSADETLLVRRRRGGPKEWRQQIASMEHQLREPAGVAELLEHMVGITFGEFARRNPQLLGRLRDDMANGIAELRKAPAPRSTAHWAIADRYAGIEQAQLVVVNTRNAAERSLAEQFIVDVGRLRKDQAVFDDIFGFRGSRIPITAVVANLADPSDAGKKKAMARAWRTLRSTS
jgi:hypothetical protein